MSFGIPLRAPCGGWPDKIPPYPDGFNHKRDSDNGIPKYTAVSSTPSESFTMTGPDITAPCPNPGTNTSPTPDNGWIGTGALQGTLVPDYTAGTGLSTWAGTLPEQSWSQDGTVNFGVCNQKGNKIVACCLQWNGSLPYSNPNGVATIQCLDSGRNCYEWTKAAIAIGLGAGGGIAWNWEPYRSSSPQTKYTALDIEGHYVATSLYTDPGDPFSPYDLFDSRVMHIASNGEVVLDSGSDFTAPPSGLTSLLGKGFRGLADGLDYVGFARDWSDTDTYTCECNVAEDGTPNGAATGTDHVSGRCTRNSDGVLMEFWEADFGSGNFKRNYLYGEDVSGGGTVYQRRSVEILAITDTVYHYTLQIVQNDVYNIYQLDCDLTATLSSPITSVNMQSNPSTGLGAKELLAWWPLNDNKLHPWRSPTDGFLQVAPLMSLNQLPRDVSFSNWNGADSPIPPLKMNDRNDVAPGATGYEDTPWKDPNVWVWVGDSGVSDSRVLVQLYDGAILGKPKPAGYQDVFCYQFEDWRGGCQESADLTHYFFQWCLHGHGMTVSGYNLQLGLGARDLDGNFSGLPLNSTQWTDNYVCINKPPGAYIGYNDNTVVNGPDVSGSCHNVWNFPANRAGALWFYKYAEILDTWPSQNFARPGGSDKFLIDETKVYFVTGTALTDQAGASASPDITYGIWGGKCVDGFYSGCSCSGGVVTLGTKVFNVPSDWKSQSYVPVAGGLFGAVDDTDTIFGQLRFPTCPSILGRASITMAGTTATFSAAQTAFGMAVAGTETVDIYDAAMNLLSVGGGVTATQVTDTTFSLALNYPGAAWVMIHGSPAWYFNDNTPKGNFSTLQFLFDRRTNNEVTRLSTVVDCDFNEPPAGSPTANYGYADFSQTEHCLPVTPCAPRVVCYSPNGETWGNGITIAPPVIDLDSKYGSKWQGIIRPTMSDLFFQTPHKPSNAAVNDAGFSLGATAFNWVADDGTCKPPDIDSFSGDLNALYYPVNIPVECELTLPGGYGAAQDETAPALPSGIVIGWSSPVDAPAANTAYPPAASSFTVDGIPIPFFTDSHLHYNFCHLPDGCAFAAQYAAGQNGC